jgi:ABC-type sugar transport system ATPase subunit
MLLELAAIEKRFGGVHALKRGNLNVQSGEVHLLMGENGAGKSTLMKTVAGMIAPDSGEIRWKGTPVRFTRPADASALGIAMVHQESLLAPHLTVAENLFLGREDRLPFGFISRRKIMERARQVIADYNFPLDPAARVGSLSPAGKQMVEICRAAQQGSSLLIFDEPTSSLSEAETQEVFRIVRDLKQRGAGVIYITHRLDELRAIGDRVTVLRDGETVHSCDLKDLTREQLIQHMVGRPLDSTYKRDPLPPGAPALEIEHLSRGKLLRDISLTVHAGEIVGLAGLIGAGRTELCRAIFGLDPIESGEIRVHQKATRIRSPRDAVAAGIALIPEDRQRAGLATSRPILDNVTLAALPNLSPRGILNHHRETELTRELGTRLRLRYDSPAQQAGRLSGGNQQKVVIAKWLARGANVFLFDEPTRGIDVGAKFEVFEVLDQLARSGAAILMVSSELPELLQVADRILVMRQGAIAGELPGRTTQEAIMRLAAFQTPGERTA